MREFVLIALLALSFPLVAYVSTLPPQNFRNEITEWGDQGSRDYADFIDYRKKFGANELVVLSWPGCDLNDPRVEEVAAKIEADLAGKVQQVSSGQRAFLELRDHVNLSAEASLARLRNVFLADSGFDTGVGFHIAESARTDRADVMDKLDSILQSSGVDPQTATFAGLGHNLYSLDKAGLESPFRMVPLIMLTAFLLTVLFVRNIWLAVFINALGTYTGCLSFNIIYLAGVDMNAIIWPLPTLTMLLTVSASLHFLSYYKKAAESTTETSLLSQELGQKSRFQYRRNVARTSLQFALKPMLCCAITTTIGLSSLLLSSSQPVRQFGAFGALSITSAILLLLIGFPAFLTLIGYAEKYQSKCGEVEGHATRGGRWNWLARFTHKFRWAIVVGCTAVLIGCAFGVPKVKTGSNLQNFFPTGHQVLVQAAAIERKVGPLASIELLLHFKNVGKDSDRLKIRALQALSSQIVKQTKIESVLSAATFAPQVKRRKSAMIGDAIEKTKLERLKEEMVKAGWLHLAPEKKQETWRVCCRYGLANTIHVGEMRRQLKTIATELFTRDGRLIVDGEMLGVSTTGEFVLFDHVDRQFFRELMQTYATAFLAITVIVLIVLRNLRTTLIALLPNLFPAVVVLGAAGFLSQSLDVASLMTASVALGIAVDDTLHFLLWNMRGNESSSDSWSRLMEERLRYCGQAMLQTSVILGVSIVLYAFCGFLPTVRFGILLSAMMFAALVGDLLFLPSLLACFGKRAD